MAFDGWDSNFLGECAASKSSIKQFNMNSDYSIKNGIAYLYVSKNIN